MLRFTADLGDHIHETQLTKSLISATADNILSLMTRRNPVLGIKVCVFGVMGMGLSKAGMVEQDTTTRRGKVSRIILCSYDVMSRQLSRLYC